ncbi:response regulator transcription factor [Marinobacterium sedimentorum]|uniref:response regulator transcription factor n=1 Tax=Marinobacterium sedimentorum TaxID=2927804 RepID=UPI0020C6D14B|nr:response regulator transcription factor [Marinobacterium sedimentorum]MCP8689043.1 response regulator transcription factor [Marinobacterium sedimentorum]
MAGRVLVIEDNCDIAELVRLHLQDLSLRVDTAADGVRGLEMARAGVYDLLILDLMLPGLDGLEICRRLRSGDHYLPILMLTARSSEMDRVLGLELGADDYLTKPFSIRELVARVRAIFRRVAAMADTGAAPLRIEHDGLLIDCDSRSVSLDGRPVQLTAREFDLLLHFARHPGRVYRREQLLNEVWGASYEGYEHTVNSHINRLRAKIERNPADPHFILTVWGVGYRFTDPTGEC